MRISDWSSDVCSSDLHDQRAHLLALEIVAHLDRVAGDDPEPLQPLDPALHRGPRQLQPARDFGGGRARVLAQQRQQGLVRAGQPHGWSSRSEEHTSELQSLMRISYAVFCLKKKKIKAL